MTISLNIAGRIRNLDRPKQELVEKPLVRIQKAFSEKPKKNKKQKHDSTYYSAEVTVPQQVRIYRGPNDSYPVIDPQNTNNEEAWMQDYLLKVGEHEFSIIVNPPFVEKIQIHGMVFVGVPVVPHVRVLFTEDYKWQWWKKQPGPEAVWEQLEGAQKKVFIPTRSEEGCMLRVTCTPIQRRENMYAECPSVREFYGENVSCEAGPVTQSPPRKASDGRILADHDWTEGIRFRVLTYNVLADQYASTDKAKNVIFSHCPQEFLAWQYRRPLVLGEVLDYKPDVACLQEVDSSAFELLFSPALEEYGFEGKYTNKAGKVQEGSAVFWRKSRFDLIAHTDLEMKQLFPSDNSKAAIQFSPFGEILKPMLQSSPNLCHALQKVGTIAQILMLAPKGPQISNESCRPICIVNTHLFFHYAAPHIRTLHVWAMLQCAQRFMAEVMKPFNCDVEPTVLFCGDLNSDINDGIPGAIQLLRSGNIPKKYWDWKFGAKFMWGDPGRSDEEEGEVDKMLQSDVMTPALPQSEEENVIGIDLESPFTFESSDEMIPEFTNYVNGYQGLLDYIWFQKEHLRVIRTAHCPGIQELGGFLPSEVYPSDHLAVVADFEYTNREEVDAAQDNQIAQTGIYLDASLRYVPLAETALMREEVIAVPTDTIYGVAALASSPKAIQRIYELKRRDLSKPLAVCVADHDDIAEICDVSHIPQYLLKDLLPGPVTIVLKRLSETEKLSSSLNEGVKDLAVRIPNCTLLRAICRQVQTPLALTSANISGSESPIRTQEMSRLADDCSLIFDSGTLGVSRQGSTIVDLQYPGEYLIIREGSALDETEEVLSKYGLIRIE